MAKNQIDMNSIKSAKKEIKKNVKEVRTTLLDFSEDIIKETVKTGEAWQKLMSKAVKNSEPLMKKQSDILFETVKGMKTEAEYSVKRFEKLTGFDFSDIRKTVEAQVPTAPKWIKEGFEYITDQAEDILTEVSKKGDEIVESVTDTAKAFAKEAEGMKDVAEAKAIEVIKEVEDRITDVAPKTGAAVRRVTAILTDERPLTKKAKSTKKTVKKAVAKKTATAKKTVPKKVATAKKTVAKKKTATPKKAVTTKASVAKKPIAKKAAVSKKAAPKATKPTAVKKTVIAKATSGKTSKGDDLKVIEGVGPKLAQLLAQAGITSYTLLANAEIADLQKVLDAAGTRYQMHNPTSWPLQARFARDGKFEALTSWQKNNNAQKA